MNNNIIINGEWDGEPIWRKKTSAEQLSEVVKKKELQLEANRLTSERD